MIMDRLYGGVCYAGIDTDPDLKYPKVSDSNSEWNIDHSIRPINKYATPNLVTFRAPVEWPSPISRATLRRYRHASCSCSMATSTNASR